MPRRARSSVQVASYITWLTWSLSYSSITNYLSALNFFLKSESSDPIDYSNHIVKTMLGGAKRCLGCAVKTAYPILLFHLLKMFSFFHDSYRHNATRAAILTAFRVLLRKSQIINSDSVLLHSDFSFFNWGMIITIRKSKTIQFSERKLLIPVSRLKNTSLCAVFWTEKHFAEVEAHDSSPVLFLSTNSSQ